MNTTNTTRIYKSSNWFNPYFIDGKEINHIIFYSYKTQKTIIKDGCYVEAVRWFGSNNEHKQMWLPFADIKRKNKIDLSSKVAFLGKYDTQYSFDKHKVVLYIPIESLQNWQTTENVLDMETDTDKRYKDIFSFDILCTSYDKTKNEAGELVYTETEPKITTIVFSCNYTHIPTELGLKCQEIAAQAKELNVNVISYDIEKLLKHFNITKK